MNLKEFQRKQTNSTKISRNSRNERRKVTKWKRIEKRRKRGSSYWNCNQNYRRIRRWDDCGRNKTCSCSEKVRSSEKYLKTILDQVQNEKNRDWMKFFWKRRKSRQLKRRRSTGSDTRKKTTSTEKLINSQGQKEVWWRRMPFSIVLINENSSRSAKRDCSESTIEKLLEPFFYYQKIKPNCSAEIID